MIDRVRGTVRRRILVNYRVDPDIARRQLPPGFEPKLVGGYALGGVCLIRLEHERPFPAPRVMGLSSENVAHRFAAVRVDERGVRRDCVYIPRRHSSSGLMRALGGRAFPGEPGRAKFGIHEDDTSIDISVSTDDGFGAVIRARRASLLPASSVFSSLIEASAFVRDGSLGYSETRSGRRLDALQLEAARWSVVPLAVDVVRSTYFEDATLFPDGTVAFDCALLMTDIEHAWRRMPPILRSECATR